MSDRALDAARLAALIDGTLDASEREALLARLASSDEDTDVLADALGALGDLDATAPTDIATARAVRDAREARAHGARRNRWMLIAASIAAIVLIPLVWMRMRAPVEANPTQYAVALAARGVTIPPAWNDSPWTATRGATSDLTPSARAARLGARITDLEVAARSGDTSAVRYALSVAAMLDEMPAAAPIAGMYRGVAARVGVSRAEASAQLERASGAVAGLPDAKMVELGAWLEAARLAAASRDADFFNSAETRTVLGDAETIRALEPGARATLDSVRQDITSPSREWDLLARRVTAVLGALGG